MWHLFIQIMKYSLISRFLWISNNPTQCNTDRQKKPKYWQKHIHVVVHVRPVRRRNPFYFFPRKKHKNSWIFCMSGIAALELSCIKDRAQIYANTSLNQFQPAHTATTQICTVYPPPPYNDIPQRLTILAWCLYL